MNEGNPEIQHQPTQVLTGTISMDERDYDSLVGIAEGHCPKEQGGRGQLNKRVNFSQPFSEPPQVLLAFSTIEADLNRGRNRGTRLNAEAKHIDKEGFTYDLHTWCDAEVWWVRASWIAVGN